MLPLPAKPAFSPTSAYWLAARDVYQALRRQGAQNPLAIAALANADMESAFHTGAIGDHGRAHNLWQWWDMRADRILQNTGIDVRTENSIPTVCAALWWELSHVSTYAEAFAQMRGATAAEEAAGVFCSVVEGAGAANAKERRMADAAFWSTAIAEHADFFALQPNH